jgi:hypothetical protein
MTQKIKFTCDKKYLSLKEDYPEPIKLNTPKWFKNLNNGIKNMTIKHCMPFLDSLTTGYLLKLPIDLSIKHNVLNDEGQRFSSMDFKRFPESVEIQVNNDSNSFPHPVDQAKGAPFIKKNLNFGIYKIVNPWKIETPPGYSCLFVPPLNNCDDRFSIISGIVNTDSHKVNINFPFTINGDKYPVLDTIFSKGTPYVQIIPFKRESWKMEIGEDKIKNKENLKFFLKNFSFYKNKIWRKVKWT